MTKNVWIIVAIAIGTLCIGSVAGACPYYDALLGRPRMISGAQTLNALLDMVGRDIGIPSNIEDWDLNGDGIPDEIQFEILTYILCLPEDIEIPGVNTAAILDAFEDNRSEYRQMAFFVQNGIEGLIEIATVGRAVGSQLKAAVIGEGMQDVVIGDEVFVGSVPKEWEGMTYWEVGDFLQYIGDGIYHYREELRQMASLQFLVLPPISDLVATLLGMPDNLFLSYLTEVGFYEEKDLWQCLHMAMQFALLDWDYLLDMFAPVLNVGAVNALVAALDAAGVADFTLLDIEADITPWFDEELAAVMEDLYTRFGNDIDTILANLVPTAWLRVVHASPDAPNVDVCSAGESFLWELTFGQISGYEEIKPISPEFLYYLALTTVGGDCIQDAVLSETFDMHGVRTLVALNTLENIEFLLLEDDDALVDRSKAKLRFLHAVPDAPALDVWAEGLPGGAATNLFPAMPFKGVGGYIEIAPGPYLLELLVPGKGDKIMPAIEITLNSGAVYTLFAMGFADSMQAKLIKDADPGLIAIVGSPAYFAGDTISLEGSPGPGVSPVSYAWYKNGAPLGVTDALLEIPDAGIADAGFYTVLVSAQLGDEKEDDVILSATIEVTVMQPTATLLARNRYAVGEDVVLRTQLYGDVAPRTYTWYKDGIPINGELPYSPSELHIHNVTMDDAGVYAVDIEVEMNDLPEVTTTVSAEVVVVVVAALPVSGAVWLLALFALCLLAGAYAAGKRIGAVTR